MPKLAHWYSELGPQGLVVIGAHAQNGTIDEIRSVAQSKGVTYSIVDHANVKGGGDFNGIPHCMLFDHMGKCLYRGSPDGAEALLARAVAEAPAPILEGKKLVKLSSLGSALKRESSFGSVLHQAKEKTTAKDTATVEEANYVVDKLTAYGRKQLDEAKDKKDSNAGTAWTLFNKVANNYKGTDLGKEAADQVAALKKDKAFQIEVQVSGQLDKVKALERQLQKPPSGGDDPKSPAYQSFNAATLSQMIAIIKQMKKSAPESKATHDALLIADNYGLKIG